MDPVLVGRVEALELAVKALARHEFGDVVGHDFHGNQWTGGGGGKEAPVFPRADTSHGYGLSGSYRTTNGDIAGRAAAVYPTGKTVNLVKERGEYAENVGRGNTTHVVDIGRPSGSEDKGPNLRAVSGSGGPTWNVGDKVFMNHDQNPARSLVPSENKTTYGGETLYGAARVVGTLHADGSQEGNVPDKSIPHWVFK